MKKRRKYERNLESQKLKIEPEFMVNTVNC